VNAEKGRPRTPAPPVWCRRFHRERPPAEHKACPYCFGTLSEVQSGDHTLFCGFRPGIDPLHFGFPPGFSREEHG